MLVLLNMVRPNDAKTYKNYCVAERFCCRVASVRFVPVIFIYVVKFRLSF